MVSGTGIAAALINVLSSIGLVVINKWLFSFEGWRFGTSLIVIHIAVTFIVCETLAWCSVFEKKRVALRPLIQLAAVAVLATVFMNLSLLYNSVGTYQLSKLIIIPLTVILQYSIWSIRQTAAVLLCLLLVIVGVGLATIHELHTNSSGLLYLAIAVITSTVNQIWMETLQKQLGCTPLQLIHRFTPWALFFTILVVPVFENVTLHSPTTLWNFQYHTSTLLLIVLSSVLAGALNISGYFVVGHFSTLTYQVIGHVKTLLILLFGVLLFSDPAGGFQAIGVAMSVVGMSAYAFCKSR